MDFAAHFQKGFRNHVVSIAEVPALVKRFDSYGCYATYFFYSDEILTYMSTQASPTVSGYNGKVWATRLPIDLDHPDLRVALAAARALASLLLDRWKVTPEALQVYFSGAKGFHLILDSRVFGRIIPSKSLPVIFASLRRLLVQELEPELREAADLTIKDRVRLLRLPNTRHEKSRLYKIIIHLDELATLGAETISELAKTTRPLELTDETGLLFRAGVGENAQAARAFERVRRQVRRLERKPFRYRIRPPADATRLDFLCAGMQRIWEIHVEPGYRNNCAIRLASEFRLLGLSAEETRARIFEWDERNAIGLPADELQGVVRSAYQHPFPYRYSCRDEILRSFCPLLDEETCQAYVASRASHDEPDSGVKERAKGKA